MDAMEGFMTVSASKIRKGAVWMSLLKQRDLLLLVKGGAKIGPVRLIPVDHKGKVFYEVHLTIGAKESAEHCIIITSKNEPQRWSSLNKLTDTLSTLCPDLEEVVVQLRK